MKTRVNLLFSHNHTYLGELTTQDGALVRCVLSAEGEHSLGHTFKHWQTQGIRSIMPREKGFLATFMGWALDHKILAVSVSEEAMPCWEKMIHLPFEPMERCVMISALSRLPATEISKWTAALGEAEKSVQKAH